MQYSARTYTVLIQVSVESLLVPALLGAAVSVSLPSTNVTIVK